METNDSGIRAVRPYFVLARVNGDLYLTKVNAATPRDAENVILDLGYSGMFENSVQGVEAYDLLDDGDAGMFAQAIRTARPMDFQAMRGVIEARTAEIKARDKERAIRDRISKLEKELALARAELAGVE